MPVNSNRLFTAGRLERQREADPQHTTQQLQDFINGLWFGVRLPGNERMYQLYKHETNIQRCIHYRDYAVHDKVAEELFSQGYRATVDVRNGKITFIPEVDSAPDLTEAD